MKNVIKFITIILKSIKLFYTLIVIILSLTIFCNSSEKKEENDMGIDLEKKLFFIAQEFVKIKSPEEANDPKYRLILEDKGNHWRVIYMLPDDMIGGGPIVLIDKKTLKVIRMLHGQ
ncbi:MAG: hypothetical protein HS129_11435 [Leptospiraceae bacterium]|nr:hypothetical protein [Leptospiraceae bacterium]